MIRDSWLENEPSDQVAVFMVWSDQLGARQSNVPEAANLLRDRRVRHFWDGEEVAGAAFKPLLRSRENAWDVWMLFDRSARWEGDSPPEPGWWEHQLGELPQERFLDGERFADRAKRLLR